MNRADSRAFCAAHGINTDIVTGDDGQPLLTTDETGMRQLADLAPDPVSAHAYVDQLLALLNELNNE